MNSKRLLPLLLILAMFIAASVTLTVFSTENIAISTTPKYAHSFAYQSLTVNITISDVTDLMSWQMELSFNPRIINCTEVFIPDGNIFSGYTTTFGYEIDNLAGSLIAFNGLWAPSGVNGSGKLCSITFQALFPGISALSFTDLMLMKGTYLMDSAGALIPFESHDGTIQINEEGFNLHTFTVTQGGTPYNITIFSNSSITDFHFNHTHQEISFHTSGPSDTLGSCTISTPQPLLNGTFAILVNETSTYHSVSFDALNQYLCFNYEHTTSEYLCMRIVTTVVGDINGDRKVDMRDVAMVARAFGTTPGNDRWDSRTDINNDLQVNMKDIAVVAKNFGKLWNPQV